MKKPKSVKTRYIQVRMTPEDRQRLEEIAEYNGVTLSGQLRIWIARSHKQLPRS